MTNDAGTTTIATCLHGVPSVLRDGTALHDAPLDEWDETFADLAALGFTAIELADSHLRPADTPPARGGALRALAAEHGLAIPSLHVQRASILAPGHEREHLRYAHRSIDAAAEWGMQVFSTGLHRPFTPEQRSALWFWTAQGPVDSTDQETWAAAVAGFRELGRHAGEVGLRLALEMYEDTLLGTAASAVRLIEDIGLDHVGLNPDIGNLIRLKRPVEDWREAYAMTLPHANYWHLKNYHRDEDPGRGWYSASPATLEDGLIDYRRVVRDALEGGYDGIFVMEQYGGDSLGVCATNAAYVRRLLEDHDRRADRRRARTTSITPTEQERP
ncbi:sugar phosphate isomerase/epimerase family protein [Agromyces sp. LY-1358]|nr:sugar phosphate isomerase/epimerase family protein [Agromyces sp. LY-1358]